MLCDADAAIEVVVQPLLATTRETEPPQEAATRTLPRTSARTRRLAHKGRNWLQQSK
jgi:hypothetical protein